jgi:hypothetical protein
MDRTAAKYALIFGGEAFLVLAAITVTMVLYLSEVITLGQMFFRAAIFLVVPPAVCGAAWWTWKSPGRAAGAGLLALAVCALVFALNTERPERNPEEVPGPDQDEERYQREEDQLTV